MNEITATSIDFIGDIHGHATELMNLLQKLGYTNTQGYYQHPSRKVFFCGDFIDRGPQIKQVLELVKSMIDNHTAFTVIGNHEYNAICYHTLVDNQPLRENSGHNKNQHERTIAALNKDEMHYYVEWFKTLPIYHNNGNFRIVHAQWKEEHINELQSLGINNFSNIDFLKRTAQKHSKEFELTECLLKGHELHMPGIYFLDKGKKQRDSYRIKWWKQGLYACKEALFEFPQDNDAIMPHELEGHTKNVPVFFGHYWLKNDEPVIQAANACCLDFSVANKGILAAYQWDGEAELKADKFVWVESTTGEI